MESKGTRCNGCQALSKDHDTGDNCPFCDSGKMEEGTDYKEIELGHGLRLTESKDMGIFLHFKTKDGNGSGMFIGNDGISPGYKWAVELLADELKII